MYSIKEEAGMLINNDKFKLVKKIGNKGYMIPKHNHPGASVLFTVVKGLVLVTLSDVEKFKLIPGHVLNFEGENFISAEFIEDSEVFITLINR